MVQHAPHARLDPPARGQHGVERLSTGAHHQLVQVAMGGEDIFIPPCLFCMDHHQWNIQGRMKMTLLPMARCKARHVTELYVDRATAMAINRQT